jgi:hypothetical protein
LNIGHDSSDPSDHVHISGIRLDGGESDDPFSAVGKDDSFGININSSQDVEIDHNELLRWRGAAVRVRDDNAADDPAFVGRINRDNADTVKVHDNSIHHNQHPSSDVCAPTSIVGGGHAAGYGVEASDGAYVTIERNVFDWNRHSIAGDGKSGTGYIAQDNLVLQHGGVHFRCVHSNLELVALVLNPFATAVYLALDGDSIYHTHAIDMHAVDTCHNGVFVGDAPDFGDHNHQSGEQAEHILRRDSPPRADDLGGLQAPAAHEHREPSEDDLLRWREQLVAPVERGPHRLLATRRRPTAAHQQLECVVQPLEDLLHPERTHPRRG